ncbi:hypothetical protein V8F20_005061 [Naviculisporaceae sp. PSN 640]
MSAINSPTCETPFFTPASEEHFYTPANETPYFTPASGTEYFTPSSQATVTRHQSASEAEFSTPATGTEFFTPASQATVMRHRFASEAQCDAGFGSSFLDCLGKLRAIQRTETASQIKERSRRAKYHQKLLRRQHGARFHSCCKEHCKGTRPLRPRKYRRTSQGRIGADEQERQSPAGIDDPFIEADRPASVASGNSSDNGEIESGMANIDAGSKAGHH